MMYIEGTCGELW